MKIIDKLFRKLGYHKTDDFWHNYSITTEVEKRGNQYQNWKRYIVKTFLNGVNINTIYLKENTTVSGWIKGETQDGVRMWDRVLSEEDLKTLLT